MTHTEGMYGTTDIVDELVDRGVLAEDQGGDLRLTAAFEATENRFQEEIEGQPAPDRNDLVAGHIEGTDRVETLIHACEDRPNLLATYLALREHLPGFDHDDVLPIFCSMDQFRSDPAPTAGVPAPFLPIHGENIEAYTGVYAKSIVYVWLEDCNPCDLLKDDFERLFEQPPGSIALFAVYGPDASEYLQKRFDVVGGPTTLFMLGNRVWTRQQGAVKPTALETEVEKLRDQPVET